MTPDSSPPPTAPTPPSDSTLLMLAHLRSDFARLQSATDRLHNEMRGLRAELGATLRAHDTRLRNVEIAASATDQAVRDVTVDVTSLKSTSRLWNAGNSVLAVLAALLGWPKP